MNLVNGTNGVNGQTAEKLAEAGGRIENENVTVTLEVPIVLVKVNRTEFDFEKLMIIISGCLLFKKRFYQILQCWKFGIFDLLSAWLFIIKYYFYYL